MQMLHASRTATQTVDPSGPDTTADTAAVNSLDQMRVSVLSNDDASAVPSTLFIDKEAEQGIAFALPTGDILYKAVGLPTWLSRMSCDANVAFATNYSAIITAGMGSSVTATANGFRITAGPLGAGNTPGDDEAWAHVLSKNAGLTRNALVIFDATIKDNSPGSSSGDSMMLEMFQGIPTAAVPIPLPLDPNTWPNLDGGQRFTQSTRTSGYRVTFAPGSITADNRDQIRSRVFPSNVQVLDENAPNDKPGRFPFTKDVTFRCIVTKHGQQFKFTYWPITGTPANPKTIFKNDPQFDDCDGAWVAFTAMPGRDCIIENLRVANLPDTGPTGTDKVKYRVKDAAGLISAATDLDITIQNGGTPPYTAPTMTVSDTTVDIGTTNESGDAFVNIEIVDGYGDGTFSLTTGSWSKLSIVPASGNRKPQLVLNADAAAGDLTNPTKYAYIKYSGEVDQPADLTATITVTVVSGHVTPLNPPDGDFLVDDIPHPVVRTGAGGPANGIWEVRTRDELIAAFGSVVAGEHIVLKANISGALYNWTRTISGTSAAKPVVLRSDTVLGRKLTLTGPTTNQQNMNTGPIGGLTITNKNHFAVWGIDFEDHHFAVLGNNIKVYRCKCIDTYTSALTVGGTDIYIAYNELACGRYWLNDPWNTNAAVRPFEFQSDVHPRTMFRRCVEMNNTPSHRVNMWRNNFHDTPAKFLEYYPSNPPVYCTVGVFASGVDTNVFIFDHIFHHNRFSQINAAETIGGSNAHTTPRATHNKSFGGYKTKSSAVVFIQNTWIDCEGAFDLRQGFGHSVYFDWWSNVRAMNIYNGENSYGSPWNTDGRYNGVLIVGCKDRNGCSGWKTLDGIDQQATNAAQANGDNYRAHTEGVRFIKCDFGTRVTLGENYNPNTFIYPVKDIQFYKCSRNGVEADALADIAVTPTNAAPGQTKSFSTTIPNNWYANTWLEHHGIDHLNAVSQEVTLAQCGPSAPWHKTWRNMTAAQRLTLLARTNG